MKKLLLLSLMLILTLSCSPDSTNTEPVIIEPPIVVIPPTNSILKPAIRNISSGSNKKTNGKTSETRKLLQKSFRLAQNRVNTNYKYILFNLTQADYLNLPTDNVYKIEEEGLNLTTEVEFTCDYKYNALSQLSETNIMYILSPGVGPIETFTYTTEGLLNNITSAQGGTYTYNSNGLINSMLDQTGSKLKFTYTYDSQGRVIDVYHYSDGVKKDMHYTYSYPDANTYIKTWYAINQLDQTEDNIMYLIFQYDSSKPGIYNKEPIYQIDNTYLHEVVVTTYPKWNGYQATDIYRPKYFYDVDGYLMKFDKFGMNRTSDITLFKYQ